MNERDESTSSETDLFGSPVTSPSPESKPRKVQKRRVVEIDPTQCKIWAHNPRALGRINLNNTQELRASILANNGQQIPAIGRPCDGGDAEFEIIVGARRHWTLCWLINQGHHDLKFLLEVRQLTDEECFTLCTLENQDRKNVSPYETALNFKYALSHFYEGSQTKMAASIGKSNPTITRYLQLAELPIEIINAYPDWASLGVRHVEKIRPALASNERQTLENATELTSEHIKRSEQDLKPLTGLECLERLTQPTTKAFPSSKPKSRPKDSSTPKKSIANYGPKRSPHLTVSMNSSDRLVVTISKNSKNSKADILNSLEKCLDEHL